MSLNDAVVLHEPLLGKKMPHHHRHAFRRIIYNTYPAAIEDLDEEVRELEARHDVLIVGRVGAAMQIRPAVVMKLRGRGWVESTKNGLVLLSPPGFVAALKGLGIVRGLGEITPEPALQPTEIMGIGVGGAMLIGGVILEGKVGTALGVIGGIVALFAGGSAILRNARSPQTIATQAPPPGVPVLPGAPAPAGAPASYGYPAQQTTYGSTGYAVAPPPPPPPPPKPTSQQRLTAAVQAYGPIATELIKGVISLF